MAIFAEISGWLGTFLIVLAYYFVSIGKVTAKDNLYQILNLIGAITLGVNVLYKKSWPAVGLEIIWATIAIMTLLRNKK